MSKLFLTAQKRYRKVILVKIEHLTGYCKRFSGSQLILCLYWVVRCHYSQWLENNGVLWLAQREQAYTLRLMGSLDYKLLGCLNMKTIRSLLNSLEKTNISTWLAAVTFVTLWLTVMSLIVMWLCFRLVKIFEEANVICIPAVPADTREIG